jgi:hypothetical protein
MARPIGQEGGSAMTALIALTTPQIILIVLAAIIVVALVVIQVGKKRKV